MRKYVIIEDNWKVDLKIKIVKNENEKDLLLAQYLKEYIKYKNNIYYKQINLDNGYCIIQTKDNHKIEMYLIGA